MRIRIRPVDVGLLDLFEEFGRNLQRSSELLRDLLTDYPERAPLAQELVACEHEGDRIAHDIIHRLNGGRRRRSRPPFDSQDVHELARALDDVVDYAEQTAGSLGLYGVEAPMEQAVALAETLVQACEQVAAALGALRDRRDLSAHLVEIHRLENEGDRLLRDGLASLFADGIDPMVVIRWKDIFDSLESAVDACETVAHILEGAALKSGLGRD